LALFGLAVFNLLDNARKYSLPGTPIEMEAGREGHQAVVRIRNQGAPLLNEEIEKLFEKYRRGSNSMNTGGAGIGLWLVRNIIEDHDGTVSISGTADGVEVTISVPVDDKQHDENLTGTRNSGFPLESKHK
jgi:K+-sensing histidine kinase KdpD